MAKSKAKNKPKTIAYLRVSTIDQNTEKNKDEVLKFANHKDFGKVEFVEETVSGRTSWKKRKIKNIVDSLGEGNRLYQDGTELLVSDTPSSVVPASGIFPSLLRTAYRSGRPLTLCSLALWASGPPPSDGRKQQILGSGNDLFIGCRTSAQIAVHDDAAVIAARCIQKGLKGFRRIKLLHEQFAPASDVNNTVILIDFSPGGLLKSGNSQNPADLLLLQIVICADVEGFVGPHQFPDGGTQIPDFLNRGIGNIGQHVNPIPGEEIVPY